MERKINIKLDENLQKQKECIGVIKQYYQSKQKNS